MDSSQDGTAPRVLRAHAAAAASGAKPKSRFAQQRAAGGTIPDYTRFTLFDEPSPAPASRAPSTAVSVGDIVERSVDRAAPLEPFVPSNELSASGFPESKPRAVAAKTTEAANGRARSSSIDAESDAMLARMSATEIQDSRREIEAMLDPSTLEFLRSRRASKQPPGACALLGDLLTSQLLQS